MGPFRISDLLNLNAVLIRRISLGTDELFKKKKQASLKRVFNTRGKARERILIVCEGQKTEKNYFEGFHLSNVVVCGCGDNTDSLVKRAIRMKEKAIKDQEPYDKVWCVFDRDSCPAQNFNNAFILASNENIEIAYTNESFELWFLLHFNYYNTALSRDCYEEMLSEQLKFKYKKNDPRIYYILKPLQPTAIRNAEKLLDNYSSLNPERDNPSTKVHELVIELNKFLKK